MHNPFTKMNNGLFGLALLLLSWATSIQSFTPPYPKLSHIPVSSQLVQPLHAVVAETNSNQSNIDACQQVLKKAALTKDEDPEQVYEALVQLEKLMREKCRTEPTAAQEILDNLNGSWRLIFTTGTVQSQERLGARINYFPIKAVQSFNSNSFTISNGIFLGDFALLQFFGNFQFNLKSRKLEFDFDTISILGLKIPLKPGEAAQWGASSGLGSESNVVNAKRDRKAFFNWISADDAIATARGGGGGLALWKRVVEGM